MIHKASAPFKHIVRSTCSTFSCQPSFAYALQFKEELLVTLLCSDAPFWVTLVNSQCRALSCLCRAIENTKTAHKELDNKAEIADSALANSQADIEKLQVEFNEASALVQQKEKELREAKEAAEQKAKQLDVAR